MGEKMIKKISIIFYLIVLIIFGSSGFLFSETLTLERALQVALEKSPSLRQANYSLEASEQNLKAQQASLKSQFSLELTPISISHESSFDERISDYIVTDVTSSSVGFNIMQPVKWTDGTFTLTNSFIWQEASSDFVIGSAKQQTYYNRFLLSYNQPLFTYNRTMLALEELQLSLEQAQINYALRKLELELAITRAFYNNYQRKMSMEISGEEYANTEESYQIIKNKVDAGIEAKEELLQAELNLTNAKASRENAIESYLNAVDNFKILLGLSLYDDLDVIVDINESIIEVDLAKAVEMGLKYRMELRQQDITLIKSLNDLKRIGAQNEFKGSVRLTYGLTSSEEDFSNLYNTYEENKGISLTLTIPLWDWGEKKSRLAVGQARVESDHLSRDEEEKQVIYGIRQAYRSLQNQIVQIEIAEQNVRNAQLTYEINLERYKNGDISSKDIGFYQNQLSQEKINRIGALINYRLALLDLKIKSLWDFELDQAVIH